MKKAVVNVAAVAYGIGYALPRFVVNSFRGVKLNWGLGAAILVWKLPHLLDLLREALK